MPNDPETDDSFLGKAVTSNGGRPPVSSEAPVTRKRQPARVPEANHIVSLIPGNAAVASMVWIKLHGWRLSLSRP
jgi:hypothetical protein